MTKSNYTTIADLYNLKTSKENNYHIDNTRKNIYKDQKNSNQRKNNPVLNPEVKEQKVINMEWETFEGTGSTPDVWGPSFWFTLHNGSNFYPQNPTVITKERMKNFIISLPVMLPCFKCKDHATSFIESNLDKLDDIVSTRKKLFNFFVDFHNYVNKRYDKRIFTYDEAYELYNGKIKVQKLKYF